MGTEQPPLLRAFFIPFFATGHLIPLVDVARLLSQRGVDCTILTTPANAAIVNTTVTKSSSSGLRIRLHVYPFPSAEVGVPEGCENIASVPSSDEPKILRAVSLVRPSIEQILHQHRPHVVVADVHFSWATWVARELGIPRISFLAIGAFSVAVMKAVSEQGRVFLENNEEFEVKGLPGPVIRMRPSELPEHLRHDDTYVNSVKKKLHEAEEAAYGTISNTFHGLEDDYINYLQMEDARKRWCVGPVALFDGDDDTTKASRGDKSKANTGTCVTWLDSQPKDSVVFVCFGSWCHFTPTQLREMALGLERSNHRFLWVVRDDGEIDAWMPEGYERRLEGRGLVIRGWAPQVVILSHPSVGAFVTHCGWNSVLEGLSAGVPMLTWPLVFEQFINEKLVVNVLEIGMKMWDGVRSTDYNEKAVVLADDIARSVAKLMDGGETVEAMKRRATMHSEKAKCAVRKGGSSCADLDCFIEDVRAWRSLENGNKDDR